MWPDPLGGRFPGNHPVNQGYDEKARLNGDPSQAYRFKTRATPKAMMLAAAKEAATAPMILPLSP